MLDLCDGLLSVIVGVIVVVVVVDVSGHYREGCSLLLLSTPVLLLCSSVVTI